MPDNIYDRAFGCSNPDCGLCRPIDLTDAYAAAIDRAAAEIARSLIGPLGIPPWDRIGIYTLDELIEASRRP